MSVKIEGMDALKANLLKFAIDTDKAVDNAVRLTAFEVQKTAKADIRTPSVGTYYKRGDKFHVASKPGDAPNTDTGRLIGSINVSHKKGDMFAYVGTNVAYGLYLETVMNRPFLEPAKVKEMKFFGETLELMIDKEIKEAGK
jgi:phage gpG-like protein